MKWMRCGVWMVAACGTAVAQNFVTIKVSDPAGVPIPHAEIRVLPEGAGPVTVLHANSSGRAYFDAAAGKYQVKASALAFAASSQSITSDGQTLQELVFKLNLDSCGPCVEVQEPTIASVDLDKTNPETQLVQGETISPARPIPAGQAPGMQAKLVSEKAGEKVYAVIFARGDEVLSGLTYQPVAFCLQTSRTSDASPEFGIIPREV